MSEDSNNLFENVLVSEPSCNNTTTTTIKKFAKVLPDLNQYSQHEQEPIQNIEFPDIFKANVINSNDRGCASSYASNQYAFGNVKIRLDHKKLSQIPFENNNNNINVNKNNNNNNIIRDNSIGPGSSVGKPNVVGGNPLGSDNGNKLGELPNNIGTTLNDNNGENKSGELPNIGTTLNNNNGGKSSKNIDGKSNVYNNTSDKPLPNNDNECNEYSDNEGMYYYMYIMSMY